MMKFILKYFTMLIIYPLRYVINDKNIRGDVINGDS